MGFPDELSAAVGARADWAQDLLCRLISFRSTTGREGGLQEHLGRVLSELGFGPRLVPIPASIAGDPDHTPGPEPADYSGRPNLVAAIPGEGGGRSVILNTHVDVVPAPDDLFEAKKEGGSIRGRGACDAKGQVVTVILALAALRSLGLRLRGAVEAQFVIEEEAGGNGSLALIAGGRRADAAVVFEPTGLRVHPSNRGAAWFRLSVSGRPVHMGRHSEGVSALDEFVGLHAVMKGYEAHLREVSAGYPGYPDEPSPVVVNFGRVRAGDWPSTLPGECLAEGGIAYLPNRTSKAIEEEVRAWIESKATPWAREHSRFELAGLRNEAFETPADNPAVQAFRRAAESVLGPRELTGWVASCDARLFFHRAKMPTIVFGPGDLGLAHSLDERIDFGQIVKGAEVLGRFLADWCGVAGREENNGR